MCLSQLNPIPNNLKEGGIGYKVVLHKQGIFATWVFTREEGTIHYPLNKWEEDSTPKETRLKINSPDDRESYPAGFHFHLDKFAALRLQNRCKFWLRADLINNEWELVVIKCQFKSVVAYDEAESVIVAREIFNEGIVKEEN